MRQDASVCPFGPLEAHTNDWRAFPERGMNLSAYFRLSGEIIRKSECKTQKPKEKSPLLAIDPPTGEIFGMAECRTSRAGTVF